MCFRNVAIAGAIALLLLPLLTGAKQSVLPTAANLEGYTYYWSQYKQRWLVAAGATVAAYHQGQKCMQTVSDNRGWYNICVSSCCQQGPLVHVEATYQGMSDIIETEDACDKILRCDFYMNGHHEAPPGY